MELEIRCEAPVGKNNRTTIFFDRLNEIPCPFIKFPSQPTIHLDEANATNKCPAGDGGNGFCTAVVIWKNYREDIRKRLNGKNLRE